MAKTTDDGLHGDGALAGYAEQLDLIGSLTEEAIALAVRGAGLRSGSRGLDVGCGAGLHATLLRQSVGPGGTVVGLDLLRAHLARASRRTGERCQGMEGDSRSGLVATPGRLDLVQGDLLSLPFGACGFDWVWCADTLWPSAFPDPVGAIRELARVVRPGGQVSLLYWSGQSLLPGHPLLEARLNTAFAATVPYLASMPPHLHYLRALSWLRAAGLVRTSARTYVSDLRAPSSPETRRAMLLCLDMLWSSLEGHVSPEDWAAFRVLCGDTGSEALFDDPDYHGHIAYTAFAGTVAA